SSHSPLLCSALLSFPTRRSSDLCACCRPCGPCVTALPLPIWVVWRLPRHAVAPRWSCRPSCSVLLSFSEDDNNTEQEGLQDQRRSEEHTSELQSRGHLVCRLLLE